MKRFWVLTLCVLLLCTPALAQESAYAVRNGDRSAAQVCITVDDCADTDMLRAIFELGQQEGVPITFFTLGYVLEDKDAELWRQIARSDCEIGTHGYWHKSFAKMKQKTIVSELGDMQARLNELLGFEYPIRSVRPPYGAMRLGKESNKKVVQALTAAGFSHAILWDVSQTEPEQCLKEVQNGSILLFHTLEKDYECLKQVIPELKSRGYAFVTVSEMLNMPPVQISEADMPGGDPES